MANTNHPVKGSSITVEPIRDVKAIAKIKRQLKGNSRDLLLFSFGINNGLRAGDLLKLKVGDVRDLKIGEKIRIREQKTGKQNTVMMNEEIRKVLDSYLQETKPNDNDYLFKSRKGDNIPLSVSYVNQLVKKWCKNLKGNYGSHSLRKTFGYQQRTLHGTGFDILCKRFNHSSPAITMAYLGIEDEEVDEILLNAI